MLVVSRRPGEKIMIGHEIVVTLLEIRGDKVRIGIEAPDVVPVHRQEVWASIQQEEKDSAP